MEEIYLNNRNMNISETGLSPVYKLSYILVILYVFTFLVGSIYIFVSEEIPYKISFYQRGVLSHKLEEKKDSLIQPVTVYVIGTAKNPIPDILEMDTIASNLHSRGYFWLYGNDQYKINTVIDKGDEIVYSIPTTAVKHDNGYYSPYYQLYQRKTAEYEIENYAWEIDPYQVIYNGITWTLYQAAGSKLVQAVGKSQSTFLYLNQSDAHDSLEAVELILKNVK